MRKVFFAFLVLALLGGCINRGDVEFSNWPDGYSSAAAVTFETERATDAQLRALGEVLKNRGIKATFFVVPGYFQENPRTLDPLRDFEVASMGWYQADWKDASLTKGFQEAEIMRAHEWFTKEGFEVKGFKAPFLRSNKETYKVLQELGYKYDSSEYYGFMPYRIGSLIEIPLSVNFDLYWDERSMAYSTMPAYLAFQKSLDESGLFTFYGHADRAYEHVENFTALIDYASKRNVWFATASEIADWWSKREQLELKVVGAAIMVRNNGVASVSGVTLKVRGEADVEGAMAVKRREGYTYAVLPDIEPGSNAVVKLKER